MPRRVLTVALRALLVVGALVAVPLGLGDHDLTDQLRLASLCAVPVFAAVCAIRSWAILIPAVVLLLAGEALAIFTIALPYDTWWPLTNHDVVLVQVFAGVVAVGAGYLTDVLVRRHRHPEVRGTTLSRVLVGVVLVAAAGVLAIDVRDGTGDDLVYLSGRTLVTDPPDLVVGTNSSLDCGTRGDACSGYAAVALPSRDQTDEALRRFAVHMGDKGWTTLRECRVKGVFVQYTTCVTVSANGPEVSVYLVYYLTASRPAPQ